MPINKTALMGAWIFLILQFFTLFERLSYFLGVETAADLTAAASLAFMMASVIALAIYTAKTRYRTNVRITPRKGRLFITLFLLVGFGNGLLFFTTSVWRGLAQLAAISIMAVLMGAAIKGEMPKILSKKKN